jgi:hypothetical protein
MALDRNGQALLDLLVQHVPNVKPGKPNTYITYSRVINDLNLQMPIGINPGFYLQAMGLSSLSAWCGEEGIPNITGLIVSIDRGIPGVGYFNIYQRPSDDYAFHEMKVREICVFDWPSYLADLAPAVNVEATNPLPVVARPERFATPVDADPNARPERVETTISRVVRDTALSQKVKRLHDFCCQVFGETITLSTEKKYAEAHHIRPLGAPHDGPDIIKNMLCICPNHHVELDYGVNALDLTNLRMVDGHELSMVFIDYHNKKIFRSFT